MVINQQPAMRNFRDYEVWKRAISFTKEIYSVSSMMQKTEQYGIIPQIQRASVSIASNIAKGCSRGSNKDFARFVEIAQGSAFEVESLLVICNEIACISKESFECLISELQIIQRQLSSLHSKLAVSHQD